MGFENAQLKQAPQRLGYALVALSGLCFGLLGTFNRRAQAAGLGVPTLLACRFLAAALALGLVAALRRESFRMSRRQRTGFTVMGLLYVMESGLYFLSSRRIPVALTALLLYLYPALVSLWEWAAGRHRMEGRDRAALALSLLGTALAVDSPGRATDVLGVAMGLATAFGYTVYMVLGARLQADEAPVSSLVSSTWIMGAAGLVFLGWALASGAWEPAAALRAWKPIAGLTVISTLLPIPLLMAGIRHIGAARASVTSTLEPLASAAFGALLLGEWLGPLQLVGGALILAAVVLLSVERKAEEPIPEH